MFYHVAIKLYGASAGIVYFRQTTNSDDVLSRDSQVLWSQCRDSLLQADWPTVVMFNLMTVKFCGASAGIVYFRQTTNSDDVLSRDSQVFVEPAQG